MYTDIISTFLSQMHRPEFQGFAVNFSLFCGFLENLVRLSLVFIFKKLSAHDFLAFRVIWKQACRLDFSIFLKPCFYGQTSSGRWNIFGRLYFFFLILASFHIYKKTSESIRPFCRRNPTWVNNLKDTHMDWNDRQNRLRFVYPCCHPFQITW